MADFFISYARQDRDLVRRLHDALTDRGRDTWVDWEGIPPTAEWMEIDDIHITRISHRYLFYLIF